jgi:uncharacterized membrane protein
MYAGEEPRSSQGFLALFIIGFFMMVLGVMFLMFAAMLHVKNQAGFGAIILIGPIPVVLGAGPEASWMVLLVVILAVLSLMLFLLMRKRVGQSSVRACFSWLFPLFHRTRTRIPEPK